MEKKNQKPAANKSTNQSKKANAPVPMPDANQLDIATEQFDDTPATLPTLVVEAHTVKLVGFHKPKVDDNANYALSLTFEGFERDRLFLSAPTYNGVDLKLSTSIGTMFRRDVYNDIMSRHLENLACPSKAVDITMVVCSIDVPTAGSYALVRDVMANGVVMRKPLLKKDGSPIIATFKAEGFRAGFRFQDIVMYHNNPSNLVPDLF